MQSKITTCPHCKAECREPKDFQRFQRRHGANCKQVDRKAFAKQLASTVRSVQEFSWERSEA